MNFNDNFNSNFSSEEKQIFDISFKDINNFLHQNVLGGWKGCPFCHIKDMPVVLINNEDNPVIIENLVIGQKNSAVWSFNLQCVKCGFVSFIHTEIVRLWLIKQAKFEEELAKSKKDVDNE